MTHMAVLGASGRLGRLIRPVWPADDPALWISRRAGAGLTQCDMLAEKSALISHLRGCGALLCLAGATNAGGQPMTDNIALAEAAIQAAAHAGVGVVLLASSAAVYGDNPGVLNETMVCQPHSEYGRAKLEMERAGTALGLRLGVRVTSLRIGNVAGADAILGGWRSGFQLDQLPDSTTPRRSYIGVATLAGTLAALGRVADLPDVINVAAPGAIEMGHLLDAAGLDWTPRPAPPGVIPEVVLATDRLYDHLRLDAATDTPMGLVAQWRRATELQS